MTDRQPEIVLFIIGMLLLALGSGFVVWLKGWAKRIDDSVLFRAMNRRSKFMAATSNEELAQHVRSEYADTNQD